MEPRLPRHTHRSDSDAFALEHPRTLTAIGSRPKTISLTSEKAICSLPLRAAPKTGESPHVVHLDILTHQSRFGYISHMQTLLQTRLPAGVCARSRRLRSAFLSVRRRAPTAGSPATEDVAEGRAKVSHTGPAVDLARDVLWQVNPVANTDWSSRHHSSRSSAMSVPTGTWCSPSSRHIGDNSDARSCRSVTFLVCSGAM